MAKCCLSRQAVSACCSSFSMVSNSEFYSGGHHSMQDLPVRMSRPESVRAGAGHRVEADFQRQQSAAVSGDRVLHCGEFHPCWNVDPCFGQWPVRASGQGQRIVAFEAAVYVCRRL